MTLSQETVTDLKSFDWQSIIEYGNSLDAFNDAQWRFFKGFIAEITIDADGEETLKYVAQPHKDYDWDKYQCSVELKSMLSNQLYKKDGSLRKSYTIKFNNSNGTNKQETIPEDHVADILLVVANDGAFVVDKETVMKHVSKQGDGFSLVLPNEVVTEVSGKVPVKTTWKNTLRQQIEDLIREDYNNFKEWKSKNG